MLLILPASPQLSPCFRLPNSFPPLPPAWTRFGISPTLPPYLLFFFFPSWNNCRAHGMAWWNFQLLSQVCNTPGSSRLCHLIWIIFMVALELALQLGNLEIVVASSTKDSWVEERKVEWRKLRIWEGNSRSDLGNGLSWKFEGRVSIFIWGQWNKNEIGRLPNRNRLV